MLPNSEYGKFSENLQGTGVPLIIYQRQRKAKVGRDSARASASGAGGAGGRDATMTDGAIADLVTLEIVKGETSLTWGGRFATLADKTQGWGFNDVQRRAEAQARETMADAVQKSGDPAEAKVHQKLQRTNSTRVGGKALRMQQVNRVVVRVKPKPPGAICRCPPLSCLLGRHPDPIRSSDMSPLPALLAPSPPLFCRSLRQVGTLGSEEASWPEHLESLSSETRFSLIGANASHGERTLLTLEAASVQERAVLVSGGSAAAARWLVPAVCPALVADSHPARFFVWLPCGAIAHVRCAASARCWKHPKTRPAHSAAAWAPRA